MLCLKAEGTAHGIGDTLLAHEASVQEVSGIELHTGLVCVHVHLDASGGVVQGSCNSLDVAAGSQNPVVVITLSVNNLYIGGVINAVAYTGGSAEVEGSSLNGGNLSGYSHVLVNGSILVGVQIEHFVKHVLAGVSAQTEVAVVGQVQHGGLVGCGLVGNLNGVVCGQCVGYLYTNFTGESVLAVGTNGGEFNLCVIHLVGIPHAVVESHLATAMQAVAVVVGNELVFLSVQCELAVADAVAVTTNQGSEIATLIAVLDVVGNGVMSQTYVLHVAGLVGNHDADNTSAEVGEAHFHAVGVCQCEEVGLLAGMFGLEITAQQSAQSGLLFLCGRFGLA